MKRPKQAIGIPRNTFKEQYARLGPLHVRKHFRYFAFRLPHHVFDRKIPSYFNAHCRIGHFVFAYPVPDNYLMPEISYGGISVGRYRIYRCSHQSFAHVS